MIRLQPFFSTIEFSISNLNIEEIKIITKNEIRNKSGIYGFLCKTNNKLYIGSSVQLSDRFSRHLNGIKSNVLLQRSINKYGLENFIFIIFEYCEPKDLITREQYLIIELKPEFNILKVAGSSLGYKHTTESIEKWKDTMSSLNLPGGFLGKTHTPEAKAKMSISRTGKTHSAETKAKFSEIRKGESHQMYGKTHSIETIKKMSEAQGTCVFLYDTNGSLVNTFSSIREAGKYLNCSPSTIQRYAFTNQLFKDKWILSFTVKE